MEIKQVMPILMMATVFKEMYQSNQIVEYYGRYGRVMYYDRLKHNVHVLFRVNDTTWKIEKCDEIFCRPAQVFLWTIESAFHTKYFRKTRTPQFRPVRVVDDDYIMEL
jgi:hypothetical protein